MEIVTITGKTQYLFEGLAPKPLWEQCTQGMRALGAIVDVNGQRTAAGVLLFQIQNSWREENRPVIKLEWLYVSKQFRYQEIGDSLLYELFQIAEKVKCDNLCCSINEKYLLPGEGFGLMDYLEEHCFTKKEGPRLQVDTTLGEIARKDTNIRKKKIEASIMPVASEVVLKEIFHNISTEEDSRFRHLFLGSSREYDLDVSCRVMQNNEMNACFLVRKNAVTGALEPMVLINRDASRPLQILSMLHYALEKALEKYGEGQQVHIQCCSNTVEQLVKYCIPDHSDSQAAVYTVDWEEFREEIS